MSGCGLLLTNDSVSKLDSTQTSRSVVDALLNSGILNDLSNTYKFTAEQTNENDLLGGLLALLGAYIGLIAVFGLIAIGMVYVLGKTALEVVKTPWFWVAFVILLLAGLGIWLGVDQPWVKTTTTTISNPSGQPPSPLPSKPSQPGENEIECKIGNTVGCNCSIFVTNEAADNLTEEEKKGICATFISDLRTIQTSTISEQCSMIKVEWGDDPPKKFTSDFCEETKGQACFKRNFTSKGTGIRAYCTPVAVPAPIATTTPIATLAPA
jgi:hypothetical protein